MKKGKLEDLRSNAVESEPASEEDRHKMEEAVLATVARTGLDDQALWHGLDGLTWSRTDLAAIYDAVWSCIVDTGGKAADPVLVRGHLKEEGQSVTIP